MCVYVHICMCLYIAFFHVLGLPFMPGLRTAITVVWCDPHDLGLCLVEPSLV